MSSKRWQKTQMDSKRERERETKGRNSEYQTQKCNILFESAPQTDQCASKIRLERNVYLYKYRKTMKKKAQIQIQISNT